MITLKSKIDFSLRPWKFDDIPDVTKYANNWNIAKNLTDKYPHPYTNDDARIFIDAVSKDKTMSIFAIEVNNEAIGSIGIHPQADIHCKNAEIGYWLAEKFWGKGIATEAIKWMVNYAFDNYHINRIYATVFGTNIASQKVLLKNNFVLEASLKETIYKKGKYFDELIYGIRRNSVNEN